VRGEPISTASEVYSLGVVLYELLTGHHPFRAKRLLMHEIILKVCEEEPEKPSTVISRTKEVPSSDGSSLVKLTPESVSQTREGQPEKLRRRLAGDLDNIVLIALCKEPQRRYASVEQLSEDLRRHLAGLPVTARSNTAGYRAGKFIQRHKTGVVAAILVVLSLVSGFFVAMRQARIAERRFNDVRQLANVYLFEFHDAIEKLPGATPARQMVVNRALEYLERLAREAGSDAQLQRELASAYEKIGSIQGNSYNSNLGDTNGAMKSYRKSLEIRERLAARDAKNRALQSELAGSYEGVGDMLYTVNDLKGGLRHYEKALQLRQSLVSAEPGNSEYRRALAEIYARLGDIKGMEGYANLGDTAGAVESYRQGVKLREELFAAAPEKPEARYGLAKALTTFGYMAGITGDLRTAVESTRRAVGLLEQLVADDPNNTTKRLELGATYTFLRQSLVDSDLLAEAVENDRKTVRMMEAMVHADPQNALFRRSLGVSYNALGRDLKAAGEVAAALENHRKALAISQALAAADPQSVEKQNDLSITWQRLGEAQAAARDFRAALASLRKAAAIKEAQLKAGPPSSRDRDDLSIIQAGTGGVLAETGDTTAALAALRQAVSLAEAAAAQSPDNLRLKSRLALRYFELGKLHARLAQARAAKGEQAANWQAAREEYQHSLSLWHQLSSQGKLNSADARKPDEVARELVKCSAALIKLS
jgi:non-specific serine/threonine protein kinase/serine/threonine-protein kinase